MRWKQWLLTIVLLVAAVLVIAYGLGERLPVEHTNVAAQTIAASPEKVWGLMADIDAQPKWRRGLKSVDELPPDRNRQRWIEHYSGQQMMFVLDESEPMSMRIVRLVPQGASFDGSWTYSLMPMDDGRTTVSIMEHGNIYSPLYRFLMHYVLGDTFNQKRYLEDLNKAATS